VPRPSQVPEVLRRVPEQTGAEHWVSRGYWAQPPMPSQAPVCLQLGAPPSLQSRWGSAPPALTGQQVPRRDGSVQETQAPLHALLQQTLSAQNPERHSLSIWQKAPPFRLPQLPIASHPWPLTHCEAEEQAEKQALVVLSQA
jgi:hypothetical protein